jgi:hypothetical protein
MQAFQVSGVRRRNTAYLDLRQTPRTNMYLLPSLM